MQAKHYKFHRQGIGPGGMKCDCCKGDKRAINRKFRRAMKKADANPAN